jgi:hypothetical protein
MKISNVSNPAYHRNGVCGEPFQAVTFDMMDDGEDSPRKMLAVRFKDDKKDSDGFAAPRIAVFDVALLYEGIIEMTEGNAWRGDRFSDKLDKYFTILQNN